MAETAPYSPPTRPAALSFGVEDDVQELDATSNPLDLSGLEPEESPTTAAEREAREASLRSSILKAGEGPVVSPRSASTRNLSFVDQAADKKPLNEVRLYERDPKPGQPGRPGSLLGPPEAEEEEDESPKVIMAAFGIIILLIFIWVLTSSS